MYFYICLTFQPSSLLLSQSPSVFWTRKALCLNLNKPTWALQVNRNFNWPVFWTRKVCWGNQTNERTCTLQRKSLLQWASCLNLDCQCLNLNEPTWALQVNRNFNWPVFGTRKALASTRTNEPALYQENHNFNGPVFLTWSVSASTRTNKRTSLGSTSKS